METKETKETKDEPSIAEQVKNAITEAFDEMLSTTDDEEESKDKDKGSKDGKSIAEQIASGVKDAISNLFTVEDDDDKDKGNGKSKGSANDDDEHKERSSGIREDSHKRLHQQEEHEREHERMRSVDKGPKRAVGPLARAFGYDKD